MPKIDNSVEEYKGDPYDLVGHQEITGHIIFDVNMRYNFRRNEIFFADVQKTKTPTSITYSTVVSRDSVRIYMTIDSLNY